MPTSSWKRSVPSCVYFRAFRLADFHALMLLRPQRRDPREPSPPTERRRCLPGRSYFRTEAARQFDRTACQTSRQDYCYCYRHHPEGVCEACEGWLHDVANDRKRTRCSTCDQTISDLSGQWQVLARRQASTQINVQVTRPSHINGPYPSGPPADSGTSITSAPASSGGPGRRPRPVFRTRVEAVRGGPEWRCRHESRQLVGARNRKREREPAKGGAFSSKRVGGCRKEEDDAQAQDDAQARGAPAAGTQLGVLCAPTILQHEAKNAPPGASRQTPLTNAYRAPWRLPTLACQPP